jgi:AcrR family transcriptional regulator
MTEPARREVILEVADRLLRHYGPQKTTMADVAREANVGVGSVYLEFPSKDALVEELSRRHYRSVLESMRRASEEAGDRPAGTGWCACWRRGRWRSSRWRRRARTRVICCTARATR